MLNPHCFGQRDAAYTSCAHCQLTGDLAQSVELIKHQQAPSNRFLAWVRGTQLKVDFARESNAGLLLTGSLCWCVKVKHSTQMLMGVST